MVSQSTMKLLERELPAKEKAYPPAGPAVKRVPIEEMVAPLSTYMRNICGKTSMLLRCFCELFVHLHQDGLMYVPALLHDRVVLARSRSIPIAHFVKVLRTLHDLSKQREGIVLNIFSV